MIGNWWHAQFRVEVEDILRNKNHKVRLASLSLSPVMASVMVDLNALLLAGFFLASKSYCEFSSRFFLSASILRQSFEIENLRLKVILRIELEIHHNEVLAAASRHSKWPYTASLKPIAHSKLDFLPLKICLCKIGVEFRPSLQLGADLRFSHLGNRRLGRPCSWKSLERDGFDAAIEAVEEGEDGEGVGAKDTDEVLVEMEAEGYVTYPFTNKNIVCAFRKARIL
ncbi:uncharacterized protein BDR25DRAFT_352669 [Lindgomyces ingoldianus]|uniref:Uncharacterized protein n=1 Tax=Lindgomyces ingoldianus TaxID=673940 RepID=A0ACB6R1V2_9PLEO|nr:uncharacterized protein BDR25DRAFT_352669 [Lindgomyces ingoldianus]KAF2473229.1 hypothetical protein BDR25DRAFT_352669 [Lindgomyces ingoldianus]